MHAAEDDTIPAIDIDPGDKPADIPTLEADEYEYTGEMFIAQGDVKLAYGEMTITCDNFVIWGDLKSFMESKGEAYVEGNVCVRRPDGEITADKALINWSERRSLLIGFRSRSLYNADSRLNWYVSADEIVALSDGQYTAENLVMSTCGFAHPHHYIKADFAEIVDDVHVLTKDTQYFVHDIPLTPKVPLYQDLEHDWPWMRWELGNSSEFGTFLRSDWRYRPFRPDSNEVRDTSSLGRKPLDRDWAEYRNARTKNRPKFHSLHDLDLFLNLDYLSERGPAFGVDAEYDLWRQGRDARGQLDTYWVPNDTGEDVSEYELGVENRYRVKYYHQQRFGDGWELDLEFNKYSDRGFQEEYFEQEFLEDKPPETRAYLKYDTDWWAWYIEGAFQMDDFRDATEYLPRTGFNTFGTPLFAGLLWETTTELAYIRGRYSNVRRRSYHTDLDILQKQLAHNAYDLLPPLTLREEMSHNQNTWRFYTLNRVSRPFDIGFLNFEPWIATSQTFYEETLPDPALYPPAAGEHHNQWRGQALGGVDVSCQFWRIYDVQNETFELSGLRHIITPQIRYLYAAEPTVDAAKLYDFDVIDNVEPLDRIAFGLRNQLQTQRNGVVTDFVDLDLNLFAYPNANRDGPEDDQRWPDRRRGKGFSDLDIDLRVKPWRRTRFYFNGDVDLNEIRHSAPCDWHTMNVGVAVSPSDRWELFAGNRYEEHEASTTTAGFAVELTRKWTLLVRQQYDWRAQEAYDSEFVFRRNMHAWVAELTFETDEGDNSKMVSLNFFPKPMRAPVRKSIFRNDNMDVTDDF